MPEFYKVRGNGCILYFPTTLPHADLLRGGKGYVVDLAAPCEREWCKDQMHKLEPAPEATAASEIRSPVALRAIREERARIEALAGKSTAGGPSGSPEPTSAPTSAPTAPTTANEDDDLRVPRPQRPAKPAAKAS